MDGIVPVGTVPDEVLLLCGQPSNAPSAWWTPALARQSVADADRLVSATAALLEDRGLRDHATGELSGLLGEVAAVVADATLLLLLETDRGDGDVERRSIVASHERAVLDLQEADGGVHDLLLTGARSATELLAGLLTPVTAPSATVQDLAGRCSAAQVTAALPEAERFGTVRITRTALGADPVSHAVTVVDHPAGAVACWALPDGDVEVQVLDDDAAVDLALVLIGAELQVAA